MDDIEPTSEETDTGSAFFFMKGSESIDTVDDAVDAARSAFSFISQSPGSSDVSPPDGNVTAPFVELNDGSLVDDSSSSFSFMGQKPAAVLDEDIFSSVGETTTTSPTSSNSVESSVPDFLSGPDPVSIQPGAVVAEPQEIKLGKTATANTVSVPQHALYAMQPVISAMIIS